jgi:hypothetical protein
MKYLLSILICISFFVACKKPKIESVNTNNSVDSLTYQPKVPGSRWTYTKTIFLSNSDYNFLRLTTEATINGKTYPVFYSDDPTIGGEQYIRQDGDKYYSVLTASTTKPELLVLDVSKNVNESWVGGVNGSDTYTYTMKEKYPFYALDNFIFKNVLRIGQVRTNGSGNTTLSGDTYYAQGIGMVKTDGTISGIPVSIKLKSIDLR